MDIPMNVVINLLKEANRMGLRGEAFDNVVLIPPVSASECEWDYTLLSKPINGTDSL